MVTVLRVLDYVNSCYTEKDGEVIFNLVKPFLDRGETVVLSFSGVSLIPSAFVNAAFIQLLRYFEFDYIRSKLRFVDSNNQINKMIKLRFDTEVSFKKRLLNV
ncbi:hypothetical protein AJ85_04725 [Alkalihalobacillus alcalophilus ATCC 27647 = CGMCC 1.3604]|uniref:DUF4325 domain-containing protein n=1 Tax=Alkalihalobacillus alcalophilus ATCC 27647 = CGMCC 1.3604 TaxID=1218173 RepID=A0A094YQD2_ALKAL|nr:STAS-like domain-containing protein [Alkalihalobacillus alcalophilus]KGA95677.1 hypothetical protein BALCAV_0220955 [Alkalihalobacillus alcalophilus ATCC 27647 = CGMCC 1.3604]MED1563233.1 STAS-like domain-containing protein [Alkalihalobacillus alcalophilus]THG91459.1 hypothetical protein AJ85_04725 [Alkalihalobacillus alcalophilus ATCC 27647 = CGMCC 1.3604]